MRIKTLISAGLALCMVFMLSSKPAFADMPSEGSHSMHQGKSSEGHVRYGHGEDHKGASRGHGHWRGHGGHGFDPYAKVLMCKAKLNLTAEQVKLISDQQMEFKKQGIRNRADQEIARLEFKRLLSAETLDEAKLQNSAKEISDMISRQISATMNAKIAVMKILTPEQRKMMVESHSGEES